MLFIQFPFRLLSDIGCFFFDPNKQTFGDQPGEEEEEDCAGMKGFDPVMLKLVPEEPYCKDACRTNINTSKHRVRYKSYMPTYTVIQSERKDCGDGRI